jgi:hypothetical protein
MHEINNNPATDRRNQNNISKHILAASRQMEPVIKDVTNDNRSPTQ